MREKYFVMVARVIVVVVVVSCVGGCSRDPTDLETKSESPTTTESGETGANNSPETIGDYKEACDTSPFLVPHISHGLFLRAIGVQFKAIPEALGRLSRSELSSQTQSCVLKISRAADTANSPLQLLGTIPGATIEPTFGCKVLGPIPIEPTAPLPRDERLRFWIIRVPAEVQESRLFQLSTLLKGSTVIASAGPIPTPEPPDLPSDRYLGSDGTTRNGFETPCGTQWYLYQTKVTDAWQEWPKSWPPGPGTGPVIFVADSGFYLHHHELENVLRPDLGINTCDETGPFDFGSGVAHGAAVVGLLAAKRDGRGIVGVAHDAEVRPVMTNCAAQTVVGDPWALAVDRVRETVVPGRRRVLVLEAQAKDKRNYETDNEGFKAAISWAVEDGVVVILAAGNGGRDVAKKRDGTDDTWDTGAIVVGATDYGTGTVADKSNFGDRVQVYAPGDSDRDVTLSPKSDASYRGGFGDTSGATPKVAGVVAMMLAHNDQLKPGDIRDILATSGQTEVVDKNSKKRKFLDAMAAIKEARARSR